MELGLYRSVPCWEEMDKDAVLQALWLAREKARILRNDCQSRYQRKRRAVDDAYREHTNAKAAAAHRKRYASDPEYRERQKQRARALYQQKKQASEAYG